MKQIKLNDNVAINLEKLISGKLLLNAGSGGGKSYAIRRILEQSFGEIPHLILDTEGEFSSLREKYDYILIGKGYDIAADPKTAALMALRLGERQVLIAIAQQPDGMTREHITVQTGYKRSTRDAYIQRLVQKGYVQLFDGLIGWTDLGIQALGNDYEPLPTGRELFEYHMQKLPEGEGKILKLLYVAGPHEREVISNITSFKRSTRDAYIQRLATRQLVVVEGQTIRISEHLV